MTEADVVHYARKYAAKVAARGTVSAGCCEWVALGAADLPEPGAELVLMVCDDTDTGPTLDIGWVEQFGGKRSLHSFTGARVVAWLRGLAVPVQFGQGGA